MIFWYLTKLHELISQNLLNKKLNASFLRFEFVKMLII